MPENEEARERKKRPAKVLPVMRPLVAGIDLGSREHWVCGPEQGDGKPNVRVFGTTTDELEKLAGWLMEQRVESLAMESTYVYWIPVYELLQAKGIEVLLVNARQLHNVPGRKTDFRDCQWIQLLHSCGLLRGSFHPSDAISRLRALQREIANLVRDRTRTVQRMQKCLDQMNVQIHRAVSDLTGTTGMAMVRAIVAGERDATRLAALRDSRCEKTAKEIAGYLTGTWREEHLFNLASALRQYDFLGEELERYDARLLEDIKALEPPERRDEQVPPHPNAKKQKALNRRGENAMRTELWRFAGVDLTRIDGISAGTARVVLTEVGCDLTAFPCEDNFVSWLRLCPRTLISGGKPLKKRRNGLGANRIANALRMAAVTLRNSKTALGAEYRKTARTKSAAVAVFVTARKLATIIYRLLRFGHDYVDIGENAYEARFATRRIASIKEAARSLGYALVPAPSRPQQARG